MGGAAAAARRPALRQALPAAAPCQLEARRGYRHWWRVLPEDFELNTESMPQDVKSLMASNPDSLGFIDSYWYWRIRAESTIMDPENLPKKSYKQLCRDMGLTIVNEAAEHILGIIELYEYLKSSPFIGHPHGARCGLQRWHRRQRARAAVVPMPRGLPLPLRRVRPDLHAGARHVRAPRERGHQPHRPGRQGRLRLRLAGEGQRGLELRRHAPLAAGLRRTARHRLRRPGPRRAQRAAGHWRVSVQRGLDSLATCA